MAHFIGLRFLSGDKARHLHDDPHQHHRSGLGSFTRQGHDPGKDAFAALAGDHFVHVGNIGVGVPRNVVDAAAAQARHCGYQQQQRIDIAEASVVQHRVRERTQAEQHHHHAVRWRRPEANTQRDHGDNRNKLEDRHGSEQVRSH